MVSGFGSKIVVGPKGTLYVAGEDNIPMGVFVKDAKSGAIQLVAPHSEPGLIDDFMDGGGVATAAKQFVASEPEPILMAGERATS